MSEEQKPQFIRPPNTLRAKVVEGGPGAVNADVLEKAEQVIAGMADSYIEWAGEDIGRLSEALAALSRSGGDMEKLRPIFQIAHDMKGQGGSFGYQLITVIGDKLCRFVEALEKVDGAELEVIRIHVDSMQLVITKRIKGDGGTDGATLLKGLEMVVAKRSR